MALALVVGGESCGVLLCPFVPCHVLMSQVHRQALPLPLHLLLAEALQLRMHIFMLLWLLLWLPHRVRLSLLKAAFRPLLLLLLLLPGLLWR